VQSEAPPTKHLLDSFEGSSRFATEHDPGSAVEAAPFEPGGAVAGRVAARLAFRLGVRFGVGFGVGIGMLSQGRELLVRASSTGQSGVKERLSGRRRPSTPLCTE